MSLAVNWKLAVGAGVAAFLLSVFSGALGGVGLGAIIVRAPLAGLLFAAFGLGLELVVRRFLPELFDAGTSQELGSRVNIVVDDEDEQLSEVQGQTRDAATPELNGEQGDAGVAEKSKSENDWDELDNPEESLVQEVQEARQQDADAETAEPELVDETTPDKASEVSEKTEADSQVAANELDELPDVGRFAEDFSSDGTQDSPQVAGSSSPRSAESDGQDPAMIAKALQTMLKRESE
ncbi:MAG: hypothetical protein EA428_12555 [Spirochaetaceae bacterium]|nr:MAG: hypothetical protein EA428_12555 [Spirochaetaceae bacterium]